MCLFFGKAFAFRKTIGLVMVRFNLNKVSDKGRYFTGKYRTNSVLFKLIILGDPDLYSIYRHEI